MQRQPGRIAGFIMLSTLLMLAGCAYKSTTTFAVLNASSQTITVKTVKSGDNLEFTLAPGRQRSVLVETIKCPPDYVPMDKYTDGQIIPPANFLSRLEIWVDDRQLSDDVCKREMWGYFNTDYSEKYTLNITDEVIIDYLQAARQTE